MIEIDSSSLRTMPVDGYDVPLADVSQSPEPPRVVSISGNPYIFYKSFLRKGFGATLPKEIDRLVTQGKTHLLVGERGTRLYLYLLDTEMPK